MRIGYDALVGAMLIFAGLALQTAVLGPALGLGPDLLLALVLLYGLMRGPMAGAAMGFFAGLAEGLLSGGAIGLAALLKVIAGYSAGLFNKNLRTEGMGLPLSVALVTSLVYQVAYGILIFVLGYSVSEERFIANLIWQPALATTVCFALLYLSLGRLMAGPPKAGSL